MFVTPESSRIFESPLTAGSSPIPAETFSPNNFKYYNNHINKSQFNTILINASLNLLKILYPKADFSLLNIKFFVVEVLKRSKTSIQSLQICSYYIFRLIQKSRQEDEDFLPQCPKKLFLGLLILASKFHQDHNYSFKTWLKVCGCKDEKSDLTIKSLKEIEVTCLNLLDYNLYLNGLKYENWCNILIIFGYDFIKRHELSVSSNEMVWEVNEVEITIKLIKWCRFLTSVQENNLKSVKVNFDTFYVNQLGKKVIVNESKKRVASIDTAFVTKKVKSM